MVILDLGSDEMSAAGKSRAVGTGLWTYKSAFSNWLNLRTLSVILAQASAVFANTFNYL